MFGINEYEWADTGETIADYYVRHSKNATPRQRFLCSKKFMMMLILMVALAAAIGAFLMMANNNGVARILASLGGIVVGAFIGMMLFVEAIAKPITRKVCGVADTRVLK
jgi:membrane associated rhomboid family serine protease